QSFSKFYRASTKFKFKFYHTRKNNYIKDILIPSKEAYNNFSKNFNLPNKPKLKENIYFKILQDLLKLPSDIKHYFKGK
ncbi:alpha-2,3-sialyltransferase, partial [Campylobacter jejuni]|nr:alpha-2,3-sialyltransferase [Campylobacter jejuni]